MFPGTRGPARNGGGELGALPGGPGHHPVQQPAADRHGERGRIARGLVLRQRRPRHPQPQSNSVQSLGHRRHPLRYQSRTTGVCPRRSYRTGTLDLQPRRFWRRKAGPGHQPRPQLLDRRKTQAPLLPRRLLSLRPGCSNRPAGGGLRDRRTDRPAHRAGRSGPGAVRELEQSGYRLRGPDHHGRQGERGHRGRAGKHPGLRCTHRQTGLDLPYPAGRNGRRRKRLGGTQPGPRAGPRLRTHRLPLLRLLRRQPPGG